MKKNYLIYALWMAVFLSSNVVSAQNYFGDFPVKADPKTVGNKLSKRLMETKHQLYGDRGIHYAEVCTWYGALRFAELTNNKELIKLLRNRFELLFHLEKELLPPPIHVDQNMFGCLPLRFYNITKDKRYLDLGLPYADTQWQLPANANEEERKWDKKGYSWQTRLWIDDMYMITIVQTRAYKVTKDKKYIDCAAKEMVMYLDELQRPNGLFYHAPDVPYYWGRGNGWMAMFTFAFIKGVKNGWLNAEEYAPAARKAWIALVSYLNDKNQVREICVGTNKKNSKQYYYDRPRRTGDYHGQGPYLWCAAALMEK